MKGERAYFNIHKLSHDPARNRFLHLLTLLDGLPGRIQKAVVLNICHGSIHRLSGKLRSLFTAAVPCGQFQELYSGRACPGKVTGTETAPCPRTSSPLRPCQEHVPPAGARLVLEKLPLITFLYCPHGVTCLS